MIQSLMGGLIVKECTKCGHENRDGAHICDKCGKLLTEGSLSVTTRALPDTDFEDGVPKWGSARFGVTTELILDVLETNNQFIFDADDITEIYVGRTDPNTGDSPAIDLADSGAVEKGVSRRHAKIIRRDGALHIIDNSSQNGTFLNGQQLVADQPRILRDGDDIRFGYLVVRVTFRRTAQKASAD